MTDLPEPIAEVAARRAFDMLTRLQARWPFREVKYLPTDSGSVYLSVPTRWGNVANLSCWCEHGFTLVLEDMGTFRAGYAPETQVVYVSPKSSWE